MGGRSQQKVKFSQSSIHRCQPLLGTYVNIYLSGDLDFEELARISSLGFAKISEIQSLMSYHEPASELSFINSNAHKQAIPLHPYTEKVISFALEIAEKSDGLFDPTIAPELVKQGLLPDHQVNFTDHSSWRNITIENHHIRFSKPTHLDLGGVAKGFAVDIARSMIEAEFNQHEIRNPKININAGGDLSDSHWQKKLVKIRHPRTGAPTIELEMLNSCLATSSYCFQEKNKHCSIINPIFRKGHNLKKSISIFSDSCMLSDALTKVYALDPDSKIHHQFSAQPVIL